MCLLFGLAFRKPGVVPRGLQNVGEVALDVVRLQVIRETLGDERGKKFMPWLSALFFFVLIGNLFEITPGIHLPYTAVVAIPLLLAVITWLVFIYQGVATHGAYEYFKMNLFPPGAPKPVYVLLTPIELISTFVLRPATLTIRLMANFIAGHLILALFFLATNYFFLHLVNDVDARWPAVWAIPSFVAGVGFIVFELLVAFVQAYIFTLLSAVYVAGAMDTEH